MALFGLFGSSPYEKYKKTAPEDYNTAQRFRKWAAEVDTGPEKAEKGFKIPYENADDYAKSLQQMASEYIEMIDDNGDGKLSYDEFEKFNKAEVKDHIGKVDKKDMEKALAGLRQIYDALNVNNEGDSEGNLDQKEVMNYLYSMDNVTSIDKGNFNQSAGYISQYEYMHFGLLLGADSSENKDVAKYQKKLKEFINSNYARISENVQIE